MTTLVAQPRRVRMSRGRATALSFAHQRMMILLIMFAAIFGLIAARLIYFAVAEGDNAATTGGMFVPARGDIVDRNGVPLARTIDGYSIRVKPDLVMNDKRQLAVQLADIFPDTTADVFYGRLTSAEPNYIRRRAVPEELAQVNAIGDIGFEYPREKERLYPQASLAAHVLGFTGANGHGVMGIEHAMDKQLSMASARQIPVQLSIDSRVQASLESELYAAMVGNQADGAAGIVLDATTGEIIAMASLPVFNPNKISDLDVASRRNAVTHNVYELGSTFKPLTIAAAIDAGVVKDMARRYDATGPLNVGGFKINDSHPMHRWLNVPETLVHSSNIVTARIADEMGKETMQTLFKKLEFNSRPYVEIQERGFPIVPRSWGRVTNMTVAYGHGIAVTPLHLASAYAALVNGGIWRPATLLKIKPDAAPQGRRVFKESTSAKMRQLLRMIVTDGTGKTADAPGYRVGGKTGSAEKPSNGGYAKNSVVATFAAAFPMDNPRYIILTMIDEPKGTAYASGQRTAAYTAAPVVKNLVTRIGPMLGIIPDERRDLDISELSPLLWKAPGER
jgi:cell division protein FtsI (penicillin-binding protein 3)